MISPWNYPFTLSLGPLVSAVAAGNSVIIKPSERVPASARLISRIVEESFEPELAAVAQGGPDVGDRLLSLPFDHFFFTGGPTVGRIVMKAAADHLSSVTLELGGKTPAVVDGTVNLGRVSEQIMRAKFINSGQTCIAPDYVLAKDDVYDALVDQISSDASRYASGFDGSQRAMAGIVDDQHRIHLSSLIDDARDRGVTFTGNVDLDSAVIVATGVPLSARLMKEEIFGPILPVIRYRSLDDIRRIVGQLGSPLTTYLFSSDSEWISQVSDLIKTGNICINETLLHFSHPTFPFGGVGQSGFGRAHGQAGFAAFSNLVPVMRQHFGRGIASLLYPPNGALQYRVRNWLIRYLGK